MGAIVTYLKTCDLVVIKLAPSGVAASLIKGTTIHNFLNWIEHGTIDAQILKKSDVLIIDEFAMVDATLFINIEQLCRKFTTKDGRYKASCHIVW